MKTKAVYLLVFLVAFLSLGRAPNAASQCEPNMNQVAFFVDNNFNGSCAIRGLGIYPTPGELGLNNDSITSIKVGGNVQAVVCEHAYFEGQCEVFSTNDDYLGNNRIGNDRISSAKVVSRGESSRCLPNKNQVSFFQHSGFKGACVVQGIGEYRNAGKLAISNDSISSVMVGADVQAVLCKDNDFRGECFVLNENSDYLGGYNDWVSSAKVQKRGFQDCVPGANQVAIYMHANYVSPCVVRGFGDYTGDSAIGIDNDSASSVKIGAGAQVVLCVDTKFEGDCEVLTRNVKYLGDTRIGNDELSSFRVQPFGTTECDPGPDQVSFYVNIDFIGPCVVRGRGDYVDVNRLGLSGISSIRVGDNVQTCVCDQFQFRGLCELLRGNLTNLINNRIGNDRIASAQVQAVGAVCQATNVPPQGGYSKIGVYNCESQRHTLKIWSRDITSGLGFEQRGSLDTHWVGSSCPGNASPFVFELTDGHSYEVVVVDPLATPCGGRNDPQYGGCQKSVFSVPFRGDANGSTFTFTVQ